MINIREVIKYCSEPIENIENYQKAIEDKTKMWDCHHVWETMLGYSRQELMDMNEYYGIPAINLIFLTREEHRRIHKIGERNPWFGKKLSEEHRKKLSSSRIGRIVKEETRIKIREKQLNKNGAKTVLQYTIKGEFVAEYPSLAEIHRLFGYCSSTIQRCCSGKYKTAYKYIWKYK